MLTLLLLFNTILFQPILSANVLVWNPAFTHSHVQFCGNIADILARDGHNVTVLSPVIDPNLTPFGTKENVTKIHFKSPYVDSKVWESSLIMAPDFWARPVGNLASSLTGDIEKVSSINQAICKGLLKDAELIQRLKDSKFELGIAETFSLCPFGIFEVLGINTSIVAEALGAAYYHNLISGLPHSHSFAATFPIVFEQPTNFWERFSIFKSVLWWKTFYYSQDEKVQDIFHDYDPEFPIITTLVQDQVALILSNTNEFVETPRPTSNMIQYIGGAAIYKEKALNQDFEDILSLRDKTVLFSLGSIQKSCYIPVSIKTELLEAFSHFPNITFLWKYEECVTENIDFRKYPNVVLRKWFPQSDLLADSRVVLFITHAGMNSVLEAIYRGKPTITIALIADQYMNAANLARNELSITIHRTNITKSGMSWAIQEILAPNSSYQSRSLAVAAYLEGRSIKYREQICDSVRLLVEYGNLGHLSMISKNLSIFKLYFIDCVLYLTAQVVLILFVCYLVGKFIFNVFFKAEKCKLT